MKNISADRKAQITVFIIIGLILIFSFGIYSYLRSTGVSPVNMFQPKSPPVVAFIDACIERTAGEAIRTMGDQGGYISIPLPIALNPTRHLNLVPGIGGDYSPKIPYWYYDGQTQIPSIRYIELQIENYVDSHLGLCLNNFSQLRDEFIITEKSPFKSNVVFADAETIVGLDYKLEIQTKGKDDLLKVDSFMVKLDVQMKKIWNLAKEILEAENRMTFFENMTINLMGSFPPEDIPFTGLSLDCNKNQWLLSDIKKKLTNALEPSVIATRFKNTDHPPFMAKDDDYALVHKAVIDWRDSQRRKNLVLPKNIPKDSFDYFQHYFQFTNNPYNDMKVVSTYKKDWGMNLLATPNQYGVLKAGVQDLRSKIMSMLCLNSYHFVYDLVYPVMISINDPKASHGQGYVFRFAFPVQIYHNQPDRSLLPTRIIEPTEFGFDYCRSFAPEDHTIIVRDTVTNAELSKVNLSFRCIKQECSLGSTKTNNQHLQWSGKFPEGCLGPIIVANRSGYLLTEKQHDGFEPFYIDMYPTQAVKFEVKRHTESEPGSARMLDPDMYAIIQVENFNPPLSIFNVFGQNDIFKGSETFDLLRADATYKLNVMLMKKISKDEDRLVGGWSGNWTVSMTDMLDARKVVFHVPQKYPTPKTDEELVAVYEMMNNRSLFPELVPEIIRVDESTGEVSSSS